MIPKLVAGAARGSGAGEASAEPGRPVRIVIDHGTEFTSKVLDQWVYEKKLTLASRASAT
jgi:hypothetical protein